MWSLSTPCHCRRPRLVCNAQVVSFLVYLFYFPFSSCVYVYVVVSVDWLLAFRWCHGRLHFTSPNSLHSFSRSLHLLGSVSQAKSNIFYIYFLPMLLVMFFVGLHHLMSYSSYCLTQFVVLHSCNIISNALFPLLWKKCNQIKSKSNRNERKLLVVYHVIIFCIYYVVQNTVVQILRKCISTDSCVGVCLFSYLLQTERSFSLLHHIIL